MPLKYPNSRESQSGIWLLHRDDGLFRNERFLSATLIGSLVKRYPSPTVWMMEGINHPTVVPQ
jgi:hypothetical protein